MAMWKVIGFDDWNDILVSARTSYGDVSVNHKIDGEKQKRSLKKCRKSVC